MKKQAALSHEALLTIYHSTWNQDPEYRIFWKKYEMLDGETLLVEQGIGIALSRLGLAGSNKEFRAV
jgi:hypothetical protein